jgi:anti-anti-sigma regulatory factor
MESYTIIREPHPGGNSITLLLNGRFSEDALPELEQSITEARGARKRVVIDLSEVTLVDRKTVQYFSEQAVSNVKLINCPVYLLRWITQVSNEN